MNEPYYIIDDFKNITMEDNIKLLNSFVKEKQTILFSIFEMNLNCMKPEDVLYIKERIVDANSKWILPWKSPFVEVPKNLWIKPKCDEESAKLIKLSSFDILCIVVDEKCNIDNPYYILLSGHDEYEDYSVDRLRIIDKNSGDFEKAVLPKIIEIIKQLELIQDEKLDSNMFM